MKQSNIDEQKYKLEKYLEERKFLNEAERDAARSFDQAMLTLSAGALGLSITFIREIAPRPRELIWLYAAWGGFILALLCTLFAFIASQKALQKHQQILAKNFESAHSQVEPNPWPGRSNYLSTASIIFFILGVILLAVFAQQNLS